MIISHDLLEMSRIIDSGQCFRMSRISNNQYSLIANDSRIIITDNLDNYEINCSTEDESYWYHYFSLDTDYQSINQMIKDKYYDDFSRKSIDYSLGIRILHQDPFEMLISFIISQQNNIPRIRKVINRLCTELGDIHKDSDGTIYHLFPNAYQIINHPGCIRNDIGAGFRDKYILESADRWIDESDRILSTDWDYDSLIDELKEFYGVGDKIANCVALFGFGFYESFPRDVWIKNIIRDKYNGKFDSNFKYAGIMQQYMYYYGRSLSQGGI